MPSSAFGAVFADLFEQRFEFVEHGAGFADHARDGFEILFLEFECLGVPPVGFGGVPALGEFAGVLDEVHIAGA